MYPGDDTSVDSTDANFSMEFDDDLINFAIVDFGFPETSWMMTDDVSSKDSVEWKWCVNWFLLVEADVDEDDVDPNPVAENWNKWFTHVMQEYLYRIEPLKRTTFCLGGVGMSE